SFAIDYDNAVVRLSGRDKSAALHEKKSSEKFANKTRAEVLKDVASRNGLTAKIAGATLKAGKIFQIDWAKLTDGISDGAILHKLAELEGARWWIKGNILNFVKQGDTTSSYLVQYRQGPPASGN